MLPMRNPRIVVTSSSVIDQGRASAIMSTTLRGIVGNRVVKVEARHIGEIGQILLPERLVETKLGLELLDHLFQTSLH